MSPTDSTINYITFSTKLTGRSMDVMTLREFTDRYGQSQAGSALGTTQMAVSKALASGRNISIKISESGDVEAFEIRPFPSTKRAKKKLKQKLPDTFQNPQNEA